MASINLVNLNDAVYRLLNPAYPWLGPPSMLDVTSFNKTNCPRIHEFDRKEVVTYKDWVTILAGNENVLDTFTAGVKTRCCALSDYGPYTETLRPWGRTFGKHKGPNGKPLAEVMPLDEMFWFYDAFDRQLRNTIAYTGNVCKIMSYYHNHSDGWYFNWAEGPIKPSNNAFFTLEPGVYGALSAAYDTGNVLWEIMDTSGPTPGTHTLTRAYSGVASWKYMNAIFFVDSPVEIRPTWTTSKYMQGELFRITPPGYWTP